MSSVVSGQAFTTAVQRQAADIVSDYGDHHNDVVSDLASLGCHGAHPQHIHRDFIRYASSIGLRLEPTVVSIEHKRLANHGTEFRPHKVLLPHAVFAAVYAAGESAFRKIMLGDSGEAGLEEFWSRQASHDWVKQHPGFVTYGHQYKHCIPIGVHADHGQHISRDKLLTIAWGSIMSRAATVFSKQLFTVVPGELVVKGKTDEQLYAVLVSNLMSPPTTPSQSSHDLPSGNMWLDTFARRQLHVLKRPTIHCFLILDSGCV
jgi:hypothetical protein